MFAEAASATLHGTDLLAHHIGALSFVIEPSARQTLQGRG